MLVAERYLAMTRSGPVVTGDGLMRLAQNRKIRLDRDAEPKAFWLFRRL
jgi:hypothetical protein